MTIVADASVALRWLFRLGGSAKAEELLRLNDRVIAPDLVITEITNAAWKFVTFNNVATQAAMAAVREAARAFDELVPARELKDRAFAIAVELRHPAYDCFYLALAERRDALLVTADDRLLRRCADTPYRNLLRPL